VAILLLDAASLYYRSYYALPESITAPDGTPVNAVRGFIDTVAAMVQARGSTRPVACWDDDWRPQWRVDLVPSYKTHRLAPGVVTAEEVPDTLAPQVGILRELLPLLGVPVVGATNAEADDVIADLSVAGPWPLDIASGDRDLVQLVTDDVTLLYTGGSSASRGGRPWTEYTPAAVVDKFGIPPQLYADLAILRGDPSDGLPGARGIGEKTALALVGAYGGLPEILAAAAGHDASAPMTPAVRRKLLEAAPGLEQADKVVRLTASPGRSTLPAARHIAPDEALAAGTALGVERSVRRLLAAMGREAQAETE
jgi:5'-3' exonuclease